MNASHAIRAGWIARRAVVGLRWKGLAGLALVVVSLVVLFGVSGPMLERQRALENEAQALRARSGAADPGARAQTPRSQLSTFYSFFPSTAELPDLLSRMQRAARDNGLTLERGEYRLIRDAGFALSRYQITYPLRGSYTQVRGFVKDVLDAVPAAALEEMTLKRADVAEPVLEARVRFGLFLGVQP